MAKIFLTDNLTSNPISIEDSLLLKAYTSNSLTNVEYLSNEDGYRKTAKVKESLTNVGTQSNLLISLTEDNSGDTVWINKNRINSVGELSSKAIIYFDSAGASNERIKVSETAMAVKVAAITKEGDLAYLLDSFTASPNVVVLDSTVGDVAANFAAGSVFTVFGEDDSNDNIYTVVSATFDGTNTKVTVSQTPTANATATGYAWVNLAEANQVASTYSPGTANTGVTATHYTGDGKNFTTKLVVSQADALTVADNAALGDGYLLYTFPAGAYSVTSIKMDMAITLAEDTTATPDVGLGSVEATGAVSVLSGTATFEDYLTGQTAADCAGTATLKTAAAALVVEAAAAHTLYFNAAATWADTAGADLTGDIAGEVWIQWSLLD